MSKKRTDCIIDPIDPLEVDDFIIDQAETVRDKRPGKLFKPVDAQTIESLEAFSLIEGADDTADTPDLRDFPLHQLEARVKFFERERTFDASKVKYAQATYQIVRTNAEIKRRKKHLIEEANKAFKP